ncbi:MAG: MAPEG family protein, partial [Pseudomonadota bacterium]|nr:MAPEG family protein [Pseudomonadota bacterium]
GLLRGKTKISIGDGGNQEMLLAMRRHANFVEYVPLALIIIAMMEMNRAPDHAIHGLAGALVVARIAHAFGLHHSNIMTGGRIGGAMLTALVTVVASIWSIVLFFQ